MADEAVQVAHDDAQDAASNTSQECLAAQAAEMEAQGASLGIIGLGRGLGEGLGSDGVAMPG